jgi:transcriptional regulator with XRE-family HTH domain
MESLSPEPQYTALGDALDRSLRGRTQVWLARHLCVTPAAVNQWLNGKRRPEPGRLGQLAATLKLSPEYLAELASYDTDPDAMEKVYRAWRSSRSIVRPRRKKRVI